MKEFNLQSIRLVSNDAQRSSNSIDDFCYSLHLFKNKRHVTFFQILKDDTASSCENI